MQHTVADNLAAEIARRRLTGRKLATALGLGQMYVARRVSGQTALDVNDLALFSDYLGIDPSVLLKAENPHQSPDGGQSVGPAVLETATSTVKTWISDAVITPITSAPSRRIA